MSELSNAVNNQAAETSQRRGELDVCPICGSGVHPQAYFCPQCSNYFCYVCRSRVAPTDRSIQCVNRSCDYFGKLVCDQCDLPDTVSEKPFVYKEPLDGYWPAWLLVSSLLALYIAWRTTWIAGVIVFFSLYAGLGYLMQSVGINIFGKERNVELPRSTTTYRCVRCSQLAKPVSLPKHS